MQLVEEHRLHRVREGIEQLVLPAIHLSKVQARDFALGESRFGGLPDLPSRLSWPSWQKRPLGFLAQIRCDELVGVDASLLLPRTGILYFFYDFADQPWGFDPKHRGGAVVLYGDTLESLSRVAVPESATPNDVTLSPFAINFKRVLSVPSTGSVDFTQLQLTEAEWDSYHDLYAALRERMSGKEPAHQMFGHSNNVQGDMPLECQLVTHGLYCGDCKAYEDPRNDHLVPGAADWRLLLQFDSDEDLGMMWGDCGMIYFWIRESDLRSKRFSESWTILQCS